MFKRLENPYEALKLGKHSSDDALIKSKILSATNIDVIENQITWCMKLPGWLKFISSKEDKQKGCQIKYDKQHTNLILYTNKSTWKYKDETLTLDEALDILISTGSSTNWQKQDVYWSNNWSNDIDDYVNYVNYTDYSKIKLVPNNASLVNTYRNSNYNYSKLNNSKFNFKARKR